MILTDKWQHRSETMLCQTCMFYVPKNETLGRCRHSAPTLKGWPAVYPDDWCGAHKLDAEKINKPADNRHADPRTDVPYSPF